MARIRKALVAALGAAVPAGWAAFQNANADGVVDSADVGVIVGAVLGAAVLAGWATYAVPQTLAVSDLQEQPNLERAAALGGHKPA